jgi:TRAP-type C4-dicarboxylate transport system substrate-binding protein
MMVKQISRRHVVGGLAAGVAAVGMTGRLSAQTPIVMKLGTQTLNDAQHEWMKIFARLVETGSKGRIKAELYPSSQLGTAPRMIESTQFNTIQGFVAPPEFLSGVDPRFEVLGSPGLFKDIDHANRTILEADFNKAFLSLGANKGLKGIGLFINSPTIFNTRTKIAKLSDFAGRKIRVLAAAVQMEQLRKLKATPVPMPLGEVLPALQQGTIDGVMSVLPVLTAFRYYDAAKYILESNQAMVTVVTVLSKTWYDGLPQDLQGVVSDAGQAASKEVFPWAVEFLAKQRNAWKQNGGELVELSAAEHAELNTLLKPIGAEVTAKKPAEAELFQLLQKAAEKTA